MAKRPRDLNQLAKLVVDIASGEVEDTVSARMRDDGPVRGRAGGLKGGRARTESLSADRRSEIARAAAESRWGKK
jgi:hypothetical protein